MKNDILHIIIPYFNICNSDIRNQNLITSLKYLSLLKNVKIYIAEGYIDNANIENNPIIDKEKIFYFKYKMPSILWIKENLINLTVEKLPDEWEYIAWVDSDILFCNNEWSIETIDKLKKNDTVQLFKTVSFLNQEKNIYVETYNNNKYLILFSYIFSQKKYSEYGHPGFGWAMNKNFFKRINGLFEYNIVGAADLLYAKICNNLNFSFKNSSQEYKNLLKNYSDAFQKVKTDFVNGHIMHLWHGSFDKREYEKRWDILVKHNYNPYKDITKENGLIKLTNQNLEKDIKEYLNKREYL